MPPWYNKLEKIIAPSEPIANLGLAIILGITALVLWRGNSIAKAGWLVYLVSP